MTRWAIVRIKLMYSAESWYIDYVPKGNGRCPKKGSGTLNLRQRDCLYKKPICGCCRI